jgi:hypothetical protein
LERLGTRLLRWVLWRPFSITTQLVYLDKSPAALLPADKESNWLPAPSAPFVMFMRVYWPKPEAPDGTWKQPPLQRAE